MLVDLHDSGGSKGALPERTPPSNHIFLDLKQFWGNFNKFVSRRPHTRVGAPSEKILDLPLHEL